MKPILFCIPSQHKHAVRPDFSYLVSQQHIPDLSQILLSEDKTYIPTDMRQQPKGKMTTFSFTPQTTSPPP